ncbi:major histocompatibility complex class I ZHA precursor, partial [Silurus meridionalis]
VQMHLRKSRTFLPEHLVTSSAIRPNGDGTYQLRKSVEIMQDEEPLYDCYVTHSTTELPIVIKGERWGLWWRSAVIIPSISVNCPLKLAYESRLPPFMLHNFQAQERASSDRREIKNVILTCRHSLFYTYTCLSQPLNLPGIYEFIALGMLDDRVIDYYDSETQVKVPKQDWMKEKMPQDYWEKGTQSRKSKEQWFRVNLEILMERMRHNKTDLHVLQWRHGCVVDEGADGSLTFVRGISEYAYDSTEFLSFDTENSRWIAPVQAAEPTKRKWDEVPILNQYTKGYLEKECVDWLSKFMEYEKETLMKKSPVVHQFAKKSVTDSSKRTLSCLATNFYPEDVQMHLRKSRTFLPEHLVTSSAIRPNGDGTYQLKKSVEIMQDEEPLYDCYVTHSTTELPIVIKGGEF